MKKLLLGAILLFSISSCTIQEESICGTVTRHDTRNYNNHTVYYLYIGNNKVEVTKQSWWDAQIGDYVCLD